MGVWTNPSRTMSVHDRERVPGERPQLLHGVDDPYNPAPAGTSLREPKALSMARRVRSSLDGIGWV
jgi:hypothetical protein